MAVLNVAVVLIEQMMVDWQAAHFCSLFPFMRYWCLLLGPKLFTSELKRPLNLIFRLSELIASIIF